MTAEQPGVAPFDPTVSRWAPSPGNGNGNGNGAETVLGSFPGASVVQLVAGDAHESNAVVTPLHTATVTVTSKRILAGDGEFDWAWLVDDLDEMVHGADDPWTILTTADIADFGVQVPADSLEDFRRTLAGLGGLDVRRQKPPPGDPADEPKHPTPAIAVAPADWPAPAPLVVTMSEPATVLFDDFESMPASDVPTTQVRVTGDEPARAALTGIDAKNISAWFGAHQVLDRVSLQMAAGEVTALIGPSGCGKSTFLRILNRMHEMIPSAAMAGEVLLDGHDVYDPSRKLTDARREIGMVFQKPNPFPAMSIYDNVVASLRLTGARATHDVRDELVESCLTKAGLWLEVRDRLRQPGGGLSGGQQQRLCIARALAIRPRVLLMDEPCSALDPTSTRRIEETVMELVSEVTIVIVTHNMQQAARVSDRCAFFLAEHGTPGFIVEHGPTAAMFGSPQDQRTSDYVNGRFG